MEISLAEMTPIDHKKLTRFVNRSFEKLGLRASEAEIAAKALVAAPVIGFAQNQEVLTQAKKVGEVVLYTTMTVGDLEHFSKAFKEKYPGINFRHVYLSSSRQTVRVMQEHRAGRVQGDVLGNSREFCIRRKKGQWWDLSQS